MTSSSEWKLPEGVRPTRYVLNLEPDLETFKFDGYVAIDIEASEPTSEIVLNSSELVVHYARITLGNGSSYRANDISYDEEKETVTVSFGSPIPAGAAQLGLDFTGELNDKLRGLLPFLVRARTSLATSDGWRPRSSNLPMRAGRSRAGTSLRSRLRSA